MRIEQFDYRLPPELIAQTPLEPRDSARLLVYDRLSGSILHKHVRDLPDILDPSLIIANNSRVRHARIWGLDRAGKTIEILVLEATDRGYYCLLRGRNIQVGESIRCFADPECTRATPLTAAVLGRNELPAMTTFEVAFSGADDIDAALERYAELPLPPYITERTSRPEQYQTVFAQDTGSAAAPTAGLHFTPELIDRLKSADNEWHEVTLHVGLGTFLPLRQEEIEANQLHQEACYVAPETAERIIDRQGKPVLAIGTTATRTLESHSDGATVHPGWEQTDLFIYPGYTFKAVNRLLTNFHLPKSSLLTLVAALIGNHPTDHRIIRAEADMISELHRVYAEAIKQRYRFYSFGDAMLIL